MRSSETVLGMLQERGKRGAPVTDLYRQLYNPQLYLRAYARLYANQGAMTKGATQDTADGMSLETITQIIELIKHERYRWTPVRRTFIPKKNGQHRPLGLPTFTDKLLQEVIRSLLEAYYEPQFSANAHGFRPGRGCHTALSQVQRTWTGTKWFIEGDITACFERLDHTVMLEILAEKIQDQRFLRLIKHLLQAGYLEEWHYHPTYSGAPQGGVVSPILSNIYLNKLDSFIEHELLPCYTQGKTRRSNRAYDRLQKQAQVCKKRGDLKRARHVRQQLRLLPTGDPFDPTYRRLFYVRYADDTLLGFIGPRSEAEHIKARLGNFLRETLKLELSQEKTLITHAASGTARFLGYEIGARTRNDQMGKDGRRRYNGSIRLRIPADALEKKRAQYRVGGKPWRRMSLAALRDDAILNTYQAEYRGWYQYYQYADNVFWLNTLHWDMQRSLVKTLASKYRQSARAIFRRYKAQVETPYGFRTCLQVTIPRPHGKSPVVATFGGISLQRNPQAVLVETLPSPIRYEQKEVIRRLLAGQCELCATKDQRCVVHQVRKLTDLERLGKKRPLWAHIMLKRRRKTLIVCQSCHEALHQQKERRMHRRS